MGSSARSEAFRAVFNTVITCLMPFALLFFGLYFGSKLGVYYYGPLIATAAAMRFVNLSVLEENKDYYPLALKIVEHILYCVAIVVMSLTLGYGLVTIIVSNALSSAAFYAYPFICDYYPSPILARIRSWILIALVVGMFAGIEFWLPHMLRASVWHAVWIGPVIVLGVLVLGALSFFLQEYTLPEEVVVCSIIIGAAAVSAIVRMIMVMVSVCPEGVAGVIVVSLITCLIPIGVGIGIVVHVAEDI